MSTNTRAWAIDCNQPPYTYLGIFAFDTGTITRPWQEGCTTALFRTRREARTALAALRLRAPCYFPKARVVRVVVTIGRAGGAR